MKKLPKAEIKTIRAFMDPIHKFSRIIQHHPTFLAGVNVKPNSLFINPQEWNGLKKHYSSKEILHVKKAVLLHEIGHIKMKHNLVFRKKGEKLKDFKERKIETYTKFEIEAHKWALTYSLENALKEVHRGLIIMVTWWFTSTNQDEVDEIYNNAAKAVRKLPEFKFS